MISERMSDFNIMFNGDVLSVVTGIILDFDYGSVWKTWTILSKAHYTATLAFPNAKIKLANRTATLDKLKINVYNNRVPAHIALHQSSVNKKYVTIHTKIRGYVFGKHENITYLDVINNSHLKYKYKELPKNKNFSAEDVDKLHAKRLISNTDRTQYHGISIEYLTKRNLTNCVATILSNKYVTAELVNALNVDPKHWPLIPPHIAVKIGTPVNQNHRDYYKTVDLSTIVITRADYHVRCQLARNPTLTFEMMQTLNMRGETPSKIPAELVIRQYENGCMSFDALIHYRQVPWTYIYEAHLKEMNKPKKNNNKDSYWRVQDNY